MIKNIIFDIGGVLVDFLPEHTLAQMGLSEKEVNTIAKKTALGPHWKELDRGVMSKEEVFELMINDVPKKYQEHARTFLTKEALKTVTSRPYARQWLHDLKAQGLNIYLLTNYPEWMFDNHWVTTFTFTDYVDGKIVSAKEKLIKPDAVIYEALLNKYNLNPQESVFIDDRIENIEAAKALKINGIHFTEFDKVSKKLEEMLEEGK